MSSYELQTYRDGQWKFDSYFDQRDLVLSEAARLDQTGRYMGVRVLEEHYDEDSQMSKYQTIFSRLRRIDDGSFAKTAAKPAAKSGAGGAGGAAAKSRAGGASASRRQIQRRDSKKSGANPLWLLGVASVLVLVGIGAVIALRSIAGMGPIEHLDGIIDDRCNGAFYPRVIEKDVDLAVTLDRGLDVGFDLRRVADISRDGARAFFAKVGDGGVECALIQVDEHDFGALCSEERGACTADPAAAARDDRDFVLQALHSMTPCSVDFSSSIKT